MSKVSKYYVREIRDELGRYPNWPIGHSISLGQIGYYDGRNADFDWRTSLAALGLNVSTVPPQTLVDEVYTTKDAVDYDFVADGGVGSGFSTSTQVAEKFFSYNDNERDQTTSR